LANHRHREPFDAPVAGAHETLLAETLGYHADTQAARSGMCTLPQRRATLSSPSSELAMRIT
jgi:hypothetical protein